MTEYPPIPINLVPTLDVRRVNVLISNLKKALGPLGEGIELIDAKSLNAELAKVDRELSGIDKRFDKAFSSKSVEEMREEVQKLLDDIENLDNKGQQGGGFADRYFQFQALAEGAQMFSGLSEKTDQTRDAMRVLAAQTGATGAELETLKGIAGNVFEAGGFESMAEAVKATATAAQQLGEFLDPQGLQDFTSAAAGIATTFDKDVNEVISKSRTFIANFGLEGKEAGNLIALAMQEGGSGMDDVLDTMDEYSQLARDAGLSAEQFVSVLTTGVKAGARDTDKLADALKETGLRLNQGDAAKALAEIEGATARALENVAKQAESGQIGIGEALQRSAELIDESGLSDAMKQKLQVAISGTQAEDIGVSLYNEIFSAPIDEASITERARRAGEQIGEAVEPKDVFSQLQLKAERVFGDIAGFIGPTLGPMSQFAQIATSAGPAMEALGNTKAGAAMVEMGKGAWDAVKGLFASTGATIGQTAATGGATVATGLLNIAMRALPIFAVIGAVGLLVTAFDVFGQSTEDIIADLDEATKAADAAKESMSSTFADTSSSDKQANALKGLADEYDRLESSTSVEGQQRFAAVSEELAQKVPLAKKSVDELNQSASETEQQFSVSTDIVRAFADQQLRTNEAIRRGEIAKAGQALRDLADAGGEAKERQADLAAEIEEVEKRIEEMSGRDEPFFQRQVERDLEKLTELEAEWGDVATAAASADQEARELVKAMTNAGVSIEEIARTSKLSAGEVQKIQKEAKLVEENLDGAATAADGAARSTKGMGTAAEQSKKRVKELADAYKQIKEAADSGYDGAFNGVLGIWQKQRELNYEIELTQKELAHLQQTTTVFDPLGQAKIGQLQGKINALRAQQGILKDLEAREKQAAREALKEKRRLEAEEKRLRIELGEITVETQGVTDFADQAEQIRREIDAVLFGIVNSSVADKVQQQVNEVNKRLKDELQKVDDEIRKVNEARAKGNTKNAQALINQLNRLKLAKESEAQAEITRIQIEAQDERLDQLREYLANQQRLIDAAIDRRIATVQREADRIRVVDEDSYEEALKRRLEILDLQQAREVDALFRNNEVYLRAMEDVQEARRDLESAESATDRKAAVDRFNAAQHGLERIRTALIEGNRDVLAEALASDEEMARLRNALATVNTEIANATTAEQRQAAQNRKAQLDNQIAAQQRYLDDLLTLALESNRDLKAIEERYGEEEVAAIADLGSRLYDQKAADLERLQELEDAATARRLEIARNQYEAFISGLAEGMTAVLEREVQDQLDYLDRIREESLLSEQAYEDRRLKIEEEAQKKRTLIAALEEGSRAALEIAAQEEALERQIELLAKKEEIARSIGLTEIADEVGAELELLKVELRNKGSQIAALADEMSPKLGEAFSGLFTGNDEQAKEGFRSYFGGLAAGLKQLAAAKISETLLNMIGPGGLVGLVAGFALRPLVTGLVNAALAPIIEGLLSFSTGGRIDGPTLLVAGDASRLGGRDREWIFRDDQLRLLVASAIASQQSGLVEEVRRLTAIVASWPTELVARGDQLRLVEGRARAAQQRRMIGPLAPRKAA